VKKILSVLLLISMLSGCATYKFSQGKPPYDKGYVASRGDYVILEYTIGRNSTVPGLSLAKERFRRRRSIVEHYYKKMGYIENHFKMAFLNPVIYSLKFIGGFFRMPAVAISDYRYEHNPAYREKVKSREQKRDDSEAARIKNLKRELSLYIQRDLEDEGSL